ncbi:preprotein translocase subunit YajC [Clostridium hydrogenum]|uniref:preprotein translocase subunit YajC n=1 Tax=Clostridium hydrogenum TaxID=2855764 RepID=UPI001F2DE9C0|nr:preprotein translocase subunit YajC [Clostridium hydrogenum]
MSSSLFIGGYIVVLLVIFYLVLWLPESRRKKKFNKMISTLRTNDEIITRGGIMGKVVSVQDDFVIIQTGPDKIKLKMQKSAIANVQTRRAEEAK